MKKLPDTLKLGDLQEGHQINYETFVRITFNLLFFDANILAKYLNFPDRLFQDQLFTVLTVLLEEMLLLY